MKINVCISTIIYISLLIIRVSYSKGLDSLSLHREKRAIIWNGYWAFACDFAGNDMGNVKIPAVNCDEQCARTAGCTHFSWNYYDGGTCWMKTGPVSKSNAFSVNDNTSLCGVIVSSPTTPPHVSAKSTRNYGDIFQFLSCLCIVRLYSFLCSYI